MQACRATPAHSNPHAARSNARTSVITRSECLTWLNQHHCSQTIPVLQAYRHQGEPSPAPQAVSTPADQQDPQAPVSALPDKATTIPLQHSHCTVLAFEGNQQILQLASIFFQRQKLISASLTVYPSGKASSWNCISVLHERKPPRRCEANGAALPKPVSVPAVPRDSVRTRPTLYRYSSL